MRKVNGSSVKITVSLKNPIAVLSVSIPLCLLSILHIPIFHFMKLGHTEIISEQLLLMKDRVGVGDSPRVAFWCFPLLFLLMICYPDCYFAFPTGVTWELLLESADSITC